MRSRQLAELAREVERRFGRWEAVRRTPQRQRELCVAAQAGDAAAADELVRSFAWLALRAVLDRPWNSPRVDADDVFGEALHWIWKCVLRWRCDGGGGLSTYCWFGAFGGARLAVRKAQRWAGLGLLEDPSLVAEARRDPDGFAEALGLLAATHPREARCLEAWFGEGRTLEEIGGEQGVSRQRAQQIIHKALQRLKQRLCGDVPDVTRVRLGDGRRAANNTAQQQAPGSSHDGTSAAGRRLGCGANNTEAA